MTSGTADVVGKAWSHERGAGADEWLTPPHVLAPLGPFDLDPCASDPRPFDCAKLNLTRADDGFSKPWSGRVWLNPPYGRATGEWLARLAEHGDGIALVFARTDTAMFQKHVFPKASGILFLAGRLKFLNTAGVAAGPAGAASCLISYDGAARCEGWVNANALRWGKPPGAFVKLGSYRGP